MQAMEAWGDVCNTTLRENSKSHNMLKICKMGLNSNIGIQINKDSSIKMVRQCLLAANISLMLLLYILERDKEGERKRHTDWNKILEEFKFHSSLKCTPWSKINFSVLRKIMDDQCKSHIIDDDVQFWHN